MRELTKWYKWVTRVINVAVSKVLLSSTIPSFCAAGLQNRDKQGQWKWLRINVVWNTRRQYIQRILMQTAIFQNRKEEDFKLSWDAIDGKLDNHKENMIKIKARNKHETK